MRERNSLTIDDLQVLETNVPEGCCLVSKHLPIRALEWLMQNHDHPLMINIRQNGIGGPLPFMLFPDTEALALFGSFGESNVVETACLLAQLSKICVVIRPKDDHPQIETE